MYRTANAMVTTAFLSTVVMGGVLLVIIALVLRVRDWQQPSASGAGGASELVRAANGPAGWSVAFVVVAFAVMGLGMLYASGAPVAGFDQAAIGVFLAVVIVTVFAVAGLVAIYSAARTRGLNSAQAAGVGSALLGVLLLIAIVAQLFLTG